jgi:DNA topoisomerase-3
MAAGPSHSIAVLAEKPSVARDIARVLGANSRGEGYLHGNGYIVTWAIGHLAALAQPHEINPAWKQWRREHLPMLPREWPLVVCEQTKDQFEVVRKILNSPRVAEIVCATDAGREGELIFRYIHEAAGCAKPVKRLWISSLTPEAIRQGFDALRPASDYDSLAAAARGRSRADWLVGLNLSRAYSLACNEDLSVGRVQTPTLAMLVERELAIRGFVSEDYIEVAATFRPAGQPEAPAYRGVWFRGEKETRLPADGEEAGRIVERARSGRAAIESIDAVTQRFAPPLLYDLTELQRHANRLYGFSAQRTLELAQALYESHKLISYPRTGSRHLSQDVAATLPRIVRAIEAPYRDLLAPGTGERPLGRRFVDDAKVSDHHAIIPTAASAERAGLSPDEREIYGLVCRRLLAAWHDDHVAAVTTVITAIRHGETADRYRSTGTEVRQLGWKALEAAPPAKAARKKAEEEREESQALPPGLAEGQPQEVLEAEALRKKTRPPKRFTEATLLTAMETAGASLEEKELSEAMKDNGLGTPATRAAIIEVLIKRGYAVRNGKSLEATEKGIRLVEVVHPEVKSPAMTGQWEAHLARIHRGEARLEPFMQGIEDYVREVVGKAGRPVEKAPLPAAKTPLPAAPARVQTTVPAAGTPLELLRSAFRFESFRPNQEAVCQAVIAGRDALLVMPTGSGKSLCYQLPGIARGGATLVVSPLIALMEDQAAKLSALGFAVGRIHSGLDREAQRQAARDYLDGALQFLFVAPERLRVSGFPEMLAKRKPSLIAIDEAHCISQWGHDFRPDYRMLGQYVPTLRPAPVIALTATATPLVQNDIVEQLGLHGAARFIHGFRRGNIAIEVVEAAPSQRARLACEALLDPARRPAIVYVPTRKQCSSLARELGARFPSAAYHAGLDAEHRNRVQERFLDGELEVMVATIAFGMGIDKPDVRTVIHTALPSSIESYYQEIGRAGRDGGPSRAILMQSYADRHTHDFFFDRDYPDVEVLDAIFARPGPRPAPKEELREALALDAELFDKALEKLWIHGGAAIDYAENVSAGGDAWRESYIAQGEHKRGQIGLMLRYASTDRCRMSALVGHFGDHAGAAADCGICDYCAPGDCIAQRFRPPTGAEKEAAGLVLGAFAGGGRKSTGRLHKELFPGGGMSRDGFEQLLGGMARAGLTRIEDAVHETDGRRIPYRTVRLTGAGRDADPAAPPDFMMKCAVEVAAPRKKSRKTQRAARVGKPARRGGPKPKPAPAAPAGAPDPRLEVELRAWRLEEARRRGIPAFRILTDRTLRALAEARPRTAAELLGVPGIGLKFVEEYGRRIYAIIDRHSEGY